jgi:two-component system, LuxR family, sensor kinase FixL
MERSHERLVRVRQPFSIRSLATSTVRGYAVAVVLVGGSALLRLALEPWLGLKGPYLAFFPAIFAAGWYGGFGPCAIATLLSAFAVIYFFLPPAGLAVADSADLLSLTLFALTGLMIAWLNHQRRLSDESQRVASAQGRARADRLDAVFNTAVDGIIVIDEKGTIEAINRAVERLFGYPEAEAVGRNVSMLMPSPYHEEHDGYLSRYLSTGAAKIIGTGREVTGRRRDGSTFPLHLSVGEMTVGGRRKFTGMLHDLTARVRLEEQLRASEARWRSIIDSAVDGIVVIDQFGRVEAFNPAAERLFGYAEDAIVGQNVNTLMPSPYHEEHDRYLARYLATGTAKIIGIGREVTGRRQNGTVFPVHLSVGEFNLQGERKFTGILHDLSGRVQMEEQLRERAALARLGEMAAVIAHEVRNPLAGIRGAIQTIGTRLPAESGDGAMLKEIVSRIDSLNEMMKEVLLFARPPQPRPKPTEIVPLVQMTANLLREDPALHGIRVDVGGSTPAIPADAEMLKIVFQNLLVNGAHAMGGQGRINVDVKTVATSCVIAFTDEGPGIPSDVLDKIFMPFFTTKARGSGLGLPTAKRLIEAQNGDISIECPTTGGTTVIVTLPVSQVKH